MKAYTEKEINEYFEHLKETFRNSPFYSHVWQVQSTMFEKDGVHTIEKFLKNKERA